LIFEFGMKKRKHSASSFKPNKKPRNVFTLPGVAIKSQKRAPEHDAKTKQLEKEDEFSHLIKYRKQKQERQLRELQAKSSLHRAEIRQFIYLLNVQKQQGAATPATPRQNYGNNNKQTPMVLDDQLDAERKQEEKVRVASEREQLRKSMIHYDADVCPMCRTPFVFCPQEARLTCSNRTCGHSAIHLAPTQSSLAFGEEQEWQQDSNEHKKSYRKFLQPYADGAPEPPKALLDDIRRELHNIHIFSRLEVKATRIKEICTLLAKKQAMNGKAPYNARDWKNHNHKIARILRKEYVAVLPKEVVKRLIIRHAEDLTMWHKIKGDKKINFTQKSAFTNRELLRMGYAELASCFELSKSKTVGIERNFVLQKMAQADGRDFLRIV
jgi:hypothetical protein